MTLRITLSGETVRASLLALAELAPRVKFKHLRIALFAAGGRLKSAALAFVPRRTGLLAKSLGVKVVIPDASFNTAHHGKPASVRVGPRTKQGKFVVRSASGKWRGVGAAQKELKRQRGIANDPTVKAIDRERTAVRKTKSQFAASRYVNPVRYAHLAGPGRRQNFLTLAVGAAGGAAMNAFADKIGAAIVTESRALAARQK